MTPSDKSRNDLAVQYISHTGCDERSHGGDYIGAAFPNQGSRDESPSILFHGNRFRGSTGRNHAGNVRILKSNFSRFHLVCNRSTNHKDIGNHMGSARFAWHRKNWDSKAIIRRIGRSFSFATDVLFALLLGGTLGAITYLCIDGVLDLIDWAMTK